MNILILFGFLCMIAALTSSVPNSEISSELIEQLREALAQEDDNQLDKKVVSSVVFREIGELAGSIAYGHILFEVDLNEIDTAFQAVKDDKIAKLNAEIPFAMAGRRVTNQITRLKRRWENVKKVFSYDALHSSITDPNPILHRDKRFIPLLIPAILGGAALLGSSLGIFNTMELSHIAGQVKDQEGKAFIISNLQTATERIANLEADLSFLNETSR
jgi:hypothetical protein